MSILIILLHSLCNILVGSTILRLLQSEIIGVIKYPIAFAVGAFIETTLAFLLMWFNVYEFLAFYLLTSLSLLYWINIFIIKKEKIVVKLSIPKFQLLGWILIISILGTVITSLYATIQFPIYFDDAMTHWSGRAKALYGGVNWSMDSSSQYFLGQQFGFEEYPLFVVIWRAISAHLNGGWNDIIAKGDSWLFFVILLFSTYATIGQHTKNKYAALGGTLIVASLPIIWYHAISGYSEIVIASLLVLIAYCLLNNQLIVAALLTACTIWTKNEGLFIFLPCFASCNLLFKIFESRFKIKAPLISSIKYFLLSLLLISPWLVFKFINGVAMTVPLKSENYYHQDSLQMFIEMLFNNPSSSIFWAGFFLILIVGIVKVIRSSKNIFLTAFLLLCFLLFIYVFCFTRSNIFLVNQMTIHRSFLQIAPIATILIFQISFSSNLKTS